MVANKLAVDGFGTTAVDCCVFHRALRIWYPNHQKCGSVKCIESVFHDLCMNFKQALCPEKERQRGLKEVC